MKYKHYVLTPTGGNKVTVALKSQLATLRAIAEDLGLPLSSGKGKAPYTNDQLGPQIMKELARLDANG